MAAHIDRSVCYDYYAKNKRFAKAWDDAVEVAGSLLEAEARRRARNGVDEPVFYLGNECGLIRKYSDSLLMFLLKGIYPKKYRENYNVALGNPDGSKLELAPQQAVLTLIQSDPRIAEAQKLIAEAQLSDLKRAKELKAPG